MYDKRILQSRPGGWKGAYLLLFALGLCCVGHAVETVSAQPAPVLVGAGDIAGCGWTRDIDTALLLDDIVADSPSATVFTAGDNVYPNGTTADFANCYEPTWGRHKARTRPSPGNHDYNSSGAAPYYNYFGANAGPAGSGYYSYNLGTWHIISLNSNIAAGAGSDQEQWLRDDLAANPASCTLAYWHHSLFSSGSGHGNDPRTQALFQALYEFGADVVITGHDHIYERFAPQNPNAQADPTGIRAFVVGTGGAGLYGIGSVQPNSQVRNTNTYGVLKLTLNSTSYAWEFIPIAGQSFSDSGSAPCFNKPQVTITATDPAATEAGLTTGTFTVTRTGSTASALTVLYSVSGTAIAGSDYVTLSGSVTIPSGAASAPIPVTPLDDPLVENNETVLVSVTTNAAYAVGTPSSATVTITSDEVAPATVTIAATDATATEAGLTTGTFTVTRTGSTASALTVLYSVSGTAIAGSDYVTLSGSVTIPSGAASAPIPVTPLDDPLVENNETVLVSVTTNAAYAVGTPSSATVTISSNDGNLPVVTITAPDATATEAGLTTGTFTVTRTGSTAQALTVQYTVSGTATPGNDYVALSGSTQITAGSLTRSITITPFGDTLVENNETIVVHLASSAAYSIGTPNSATVTLSSDDVGVPPGPDGEVSLTAQSAYDNKNGKTYIVGGPDGVDPLNDLNTLAEEYKVEIEAGNTFWWEVTYADPVVGSAAPSEVRVTVQYRSETNWTGTLRAEYYHGTTLLASTPLPVNSSNDPAAGKGQKHTYVWNLSSVVTTVQALSNARVRLINQSTNGKKVWVTYSVTNATLDEAP